MQMGLRGGEGVCTDGGEGSDRDKGKVSRRGGVTAKASEPLAAIALREKKALHNPGPEGFTTCEREEEMRVLPGLAVCLHKPASDKQGLFGMRACPQEEGPPPTLAYSHPRLEAHMGRCKVAKGRFLDIVNGVT